MKVNNVTLSGWINSDIYGTEKFASFFLRFDKNSSVKIVCFGDTINTARNLARGSYVVVTGKLRTNTYKDTVSLEISAQSITLEDSSRKPTKATKSKFDF